MITFKYQLNQNNIVLKVSNWCGLERVFVDGKLVSQKFNFGISSKHNVVLNNGKKCRLQLLIDSQTNLLSCRVYKQNNLVTTLRQGKKQLLASLRMFEAAAIGTTLTLASLIAISSYLIT